MSNEPSSFRYGDTPTYEIASKFLEDCQSIEDWGCGAGGFMRYCDRAIGVDGSDTPFASKKFIDLQNYTTDCEAIHMRHVLEHNYGWQKILINALNSARKKLVVTLFIPLNDETKQLAHNKPHGVDVPDMQISESDFLSIVNLKNPSKMTRQILNTDTSYGREEIILIEL